VILKKIMNNIKSVYIILFTVFSFNSFADNKEFNSWIELFKKKAIATGISKPSVDDFMSGARFLPKVLEYDRYQPEFYENTHTYINKRTNKKKVKKGLAL